MQVLYPYPRRPGRIDLGGLEAELKKGDIGTVVVTIGTTGLGVVDPLPGILSLRDRYEFRIHADAAYGGYFGLSSLLHPDTRASYEMLRRVDLRSLRTDITTFAMI